MFGPFYNILNSVVAIIIEVSGNKIFKIIANFALIISIIVCTILVIPGKDKPGPSETGESGTKLEELWSTENVVGFYKALVEHVPGSKDLITLTIKKNDENPTICTIEYILANVLSIKSGKGTLNLTELSIYIPELGTGKVKRDRDGKVNLSFIYNRGEVHFVRSDI